MKLPDINYTTPVQSLGREDPGLPVRLASAEAQIAGQLVRTGTEIYTKVQEQKALNYWANTQRQLGDIETEFSTKPAISGRVLKEDFDSRIAGIRAKANQDLGGIANETWSQRFNQQANVARLKIIAGNALVLAKQERAATLNSLELTAKTNLPEAMSNLQDSPMFSDAEKTKTRKTLRVTSDLAQIEKALYSNDPIFLRETIGRLEKGRTVLEGRERRVQISFLKTALNTATAEEQGQFAMEREIAASDLELGIAAGTDGPISVNFAATTMARDGKPIISGRTRTRLLSVWGKVQVERAQQSRRSAVLSISFENEFPMNPGDKQAVLAVNEEYAARKNAILDLADPNEQALAQQDLNEWSIKAAKLNILPDQMRDDFATFAFAGKPQWAADQSNIYKVLQREAPSAITGLSQDVKSFYDQTALSMRAGMESIEAVRIARENYNLPKEIKADFQDRYTAYIKDNPPMKRLTEIYHSDDYFDTQFFGEPDPTPIEAVTFNAIVQQRYINNNGNIEQAQAAALDEFKTIFSGSTLGNPDGDVRAMPYAPDRMFGLSNEVLRKDITDFASRYKLPNPERAYVRAHANTAAEQLKTYDVWQVDDDDNISKATDRRPGKTFGQPLSWTPDISAPRRAQMKEAKITIDEAVPTDKSVSIVPEF